MSLEELMDVEVISSAWPLPLRSEQISVTSTFGSGFDVSGLDRAMSGNPLARSSVLHAEGPVIQTGYGG